MRNSSSTVSVQSKKHKISPCLIVAACVFLAALLFFGVWALFFQKSIVGTWGVTFTDDSSDKNTVVYSLKFKFDPMTDAEEVGTGDVTVNLGNISYFGTYRFMESDDGKPQIWIYSILDGATFINSHLNYEVEGNVLTGKTLKLTDTEGGFIPFGDDMDFEMKPSVIEYKIAKIDDAKLDKAILGSWEGGTNTIYTYTFNEDQTFAVSSKYRYISGSYSANNGTITLCYYTTTGEVQNDTLSYTVNDTGTVSFNKLEFTKKD